MSETSTCVGSASGRRGGMPHVCSSGHTISDSDAAGHIFELGVQCFLAARTAGRPTFSSNASSPPNHCELLHVHDRGGPARLEPSESWLQQACSRSVGAGRAQIGASEVSHGRFAALRGLDASIHVPWWREGPGACKPAREGAEGRPEACACIPMTGEYSATAQCSATLPFRPPHQCRRFSSSSRHTWIWWR